MHSFVCICITNKEDMGKPLGKNHNMQMQTQAHTHYFWKINTLRVGFSEFTQTYSPGHA